MVTRGLHKLVRALQSDPQARQKGKGQGKGKGHVRNPDKYLQKSVKENDLGPTANVEASVASDRLLFTLRAFPIAPPVDQRQPIVPVTPPSVPPVAYADGWPLLHPPVWVVDQQRVGLPTLPRICETYLVSPAQPPPVRPGARSLWTLFG